MYFVFIIILFFFGAKVKHSDDNNFPKIIPNISSVVTDHGYWRQYRVCHPKFSWSLPLGLNNVTLPLFWAQPENHRHFHDTNNSEHCGIVRLIHNGQVFQPFPVISNETHFINTVNAPLKSIIPDYNNKKTNGDFLLMLTGHWGHYFQHFFDNIGPQIALALEVLGVEPSNLSILVDTSPLFPNVPKLWKRMGFTNILNSNRNGYTSSVIAMIESCPRVHPDFFRITRKYLKLPKKKPEKIIWISRKMANSYFNQRFVLNEFQIIEKLQRKYGKRNFIQYDHSQYTLDQTIDLFASARVIIGSHGGGMYNQFFASKDAAIVEIMPIRSNGLYPDQNRFDEIPNFSHMAVWSNSLLIGQKFWRYYEITNSSNFNVDIPNFMKFLRQIPEMTIDDVDFNL